MKLEKIYEKIKKYLELIEEDDIEKKKINKLNEKIEDKISKIKEKVKTSDNIEEENRLREEIGLLKKFKKQLKEKK
jgi:oligoendopeptidase F